MKKLILTTFSLLALVACETTSVDVSPRQSYRPPNGKDLWDISGSLDNKFNQITGAVERNLKVYINDELAVQGSLSRMATGELSGKYKKHKVNSICASELKTPTWLDVRCTILIDNERAATLTF